MISLAIHTYHAYYGIKEWSVPNWFRMSFSLFDSFYYGKWNVIKWVASVHVALGQSLYRERERERHLLSEENRSYFIRPKSFGFEFRNESQNPANLIFQSIIHRPGLRPKSILTHGSAWFIIGCS